ncbi:MAG: phosphoglycerate kinase [Candidatus Paceibacterota bacterium]
MRTIRGIPVLEKIPVLVRTALNVPIANGEVANDYRLRRALPTIKFLAERGARVILISHIGEHGTETLAPVAKALGNLLPRVSFFGETIGPRTRNAVRNLLPGHVLVLENLRRDRGEKMNDPAFARELAALADVFVQDSFDTCHRAHSSIVGVPKLLPSYAGLLLEEEIRELRKARSPKSPSLAIIGGAKFSTKEAVLIELLKTYNHVFVGGALADDFLKASGKDVGGSLVSPEDNQKAIRRLLVNPKLVLPIDSVIEHDMILDQGAGTNALLDSLARKAKTILWNGPLGKYEEGFTVGTDAFAHSVAASGAHSIVGGGDTIAAIERLGLLSKFSFVSTGGGAMLNFLVDDTLIGITALG